MAPTSDPYNKLLTLIDEWLSYKEAENGKIAQLDADIASVADQVIQSPLSLLEDRLSDPCRENLQYARQGIAEEEIVDDCEECEADDCEVCERVRYLLELDAACAAVDRAIFCLFLATELNRGGSGRQAEALTKHALRYTPSDDHQLRAVAYLSQGALCIQAGTGRSLYQARQVYAEALEQLSILGTQVNEAGYRKKAKAFEVLRGSVGRCLTQIKVVPFRTKAIRVIGEITAGKGKINPDEITGFIQQTDEYEFQIKGQPLKTKPLGKKQITFSKEYDYIAVQVSGNSMDRADISPGDYAFLRRAKTTPLSPSSGDIVAVVFRDEDNRATLKRILIEPHRVVFRPESSNPEHKSRDLPPEAFAGDNPPVAIVGIAIVVLKPQPPKVV